MKSITQDMKYEQSLVEYTRKYGVGRASRKYNKARSSIYFWLNDYDGSIESLACQSRRLHSHPTQHTQEELILIKNLRRRNPSLGLSDLWSKLRERGYSPRMESLYRVLLCVGNILILKK